MRYDFLWKIETGVVRTLTLLEDGTPVVLGLWGAGDIVGRVLSKADPYQIECLTPVEATVVPKQNWYEVTEAMISHIQRSGELMEILHCRQAEASLLRLFAWLAQRFGQQTGQGKLIDLRLTHQDIAELTGLTRVTVTRILKDLENQGVIQRKQRNFIVLHDQLPFWHYEI
jgi:CRP-like cAMP-binding protein